MRSDLNRPFSTTNSLFPACLLSLIAVFLIYFERGTKEYRTVSLVAPHSAVSAVRISPRHYDWIGVG